MLFCFHPSTQNELLLCTYLTPVITLFPFSVPPVSSPCSPLHHLPHLMLHLSLSLSLLPLAVPSVMLSLHLSLLSHSFLIKISLYQGILLWWWFKWRGWHKLNITVRPKQILSAMVKFAALAIFQKAFVFFLEPISVPPPIYLIFFTDIHSVYFFNF